MPKVIISVNGVKRSVFADGDTPLLWVLRDNLGLTGTKYGCGEGICGACTVHIDNKAVHSCTMTLNEAAGKSITTIEGFAQKKNHPLFKAWIEFEASQCGYCQPGQIMTAAALLNEKSKPSAKEISEIMSTVLCRCGTYPRIKKALDKVIEGGET